MLGKEIQSLKVHIEGIDYQFSGRYGHLQYKPLIVVTEKYTENDTAHTNDDQISRTIVINIVFDEFHDTRTNGEMEKHKKTCVTIAEEDLHCS